MKNLTINRADCTRFYIPVDEDRLKFKYEKTVDGVDYYYCPYLYYYDSKTGEVTKEPSNKDNYLYFGWNGYLVYGCRASNYVHERDQVSVTLIKNHVESAVPYSRERFLVEHKAHQEKVDLERAEHYKRMQEEEERQKREKEARRAQQIQESILSLKEGKEIAVEQFIEVLKHFNLWGELHIRTKGFFLSGKITEVGRTAFWKARGVKIPDGVLWARNNLFKLLDEEK